MSQTTTPSGENVDPLAAHEALWRLFDTVESGTSQDYRALQETGLMRGLRRHAEARPAVAALIARNAELEAERDAIRESADWAIASLSRKEISRTAERDALSAENKELRRQLERS